MVVGDVVAAVLTKISCGGVSGRKQVWQQYEVGTTGRAGIASLGVGGAAVAGVLVQNKILGPC